MWMFEYVLYVHATHTEIQSDNFIPQKSIASLDAHFKFISF